MRFIVMINAIGRPPACKITEVRMGNYLLIWNDLSIVLSLSLQASSYPPPLASLPTSTHVAPLTHRALVRVEGTDASTLLQGLVTCDVFSGSEVTYSMMLNVQVSFT